MSNDKIKVSYIACNTCGHGTTDVAIYFSHTTEDGTDVYLCPVCNSETTMVEVDNNS